MLLARCGVLVMVALAAGTALADTPASSVYTRAVAPGGTYPGVDAQSEGWFDVGGFCKVVNVGDLSSLSPTAHGIPVFIPGPATQWENYRTLAATHYNGQLLLTTCCRPQASISTICATATNPQSVSRQYGKYGEADTVSATCIASDGSTYVETETITCQGSTGNPSIDNGPDGQAVWSETSDSGPPSCPAQAVTWANPSFTDICSGNLSQTPEGQSATAAADIVADGGFAGTATFTCTAGGWVPNQVVPGTSTAEGSCYAVPQCGITDLTWTDPSTGLQCNGNSPVGYVNTAPVTVTVTTAENATGSANFQCVYPANWPIKPVFWQQVGPGTCDACTPGPWSGCAGGFQTETDSCGIVHQKACACVPAPNSCSGTCGGGAGTDSCGNACTNNTACGPPPPPTYCAPGTVFSSCYLQTYQCTGGPNIGVTYDDCGNECGSAQNTNPSTTQSYTWATPTCGNGTQCQYGSHGCLINTPFSSGVLVDIVCNNADGSVSCPVPTYPQ